MFACLTILFITFAPYYKIRITMSKKKNEEKDEDLDDDPLGLLEALGLKLPIMNTPGMPENVPVLTTRNTVLFPGVVMPLIVGRERSMKLVKDAEDNSEYIAAVCQKDDNVENPTRDDLYDDGVYARVLNSLDMPDGTKTIIVRGICHLRLGEQTQTDPYMRADATVVEEIDTDKDDEEAQEAYTQLRDLAKEYVTDNEKATNQTAEGLDGFTNEAMSMDILCTSLPLATEDRIMLLQITDMKERLFTLIKIVKREIGLLKLKKSVEEKTREDINRQQREYFLQQEIKNLQAEMGSSGRSPEAEDLLEKASHLFWSDETEDLFMKELDKLGQLNPQSPEYSLQLSYLQTMVSLPWGKYTEDDLRISKAQKALDKNHYGMEKVKERILEYIAVLGMRNDLKSPILCLYGPPGVGKTSLGKSVADALNRKYVRMSLGGIHDEAEIRGHRRTYVGAMPGRIIKGIQKAGSANPVFILDEIDKVTQMTFNGDPSSALLEVLDPEQNVAFHDNYLDIDFDLSKVLFIATANDLGTIPPPLLDRMELIEVSGYTTEEKIEIAKRHLIPRELENTGFANTDCKISFTKAAIEKIVEQYTRESGVRQLEKEINKALRKMALKYRRDAEQPLQRITPQEVEGLLGKPPYYRDIYQGNKYAGVVTGLAWTRVGGEILFIETSLSRGKGSKLTITGNLGDVMKESAMLAFEYVKAHADVLNIDYRIFETWNTHIHVPEGATPKDGPSAGITIATSLASALTQRKVRTNTAMTGEITLRGKVLPVGGIKEKILAAKRAGITDIVLSKDNKKDIEEIPQVYLKGVTFHYVENVQEVWDFALTDELVEKPLKFDVDADLQSDKK